MDSLVKTLGWIVLGFAGFGFLVGAGQQRHLKQSDIMRPDDVGHSLGVEVTGAAGRLAEQYFPEKYEVVDPASVPQYLDEYSRPEVYNP